VLLPPDWLECDDEPEEEEDEWLEEEEWLVGVGFF
jgi:hypothetical protein